MSEFHHRIMNMELTAHYAFHDKLIERDTRHRAAEIALEADATIAERDAEISRLTAHAETIERLWDDDNRLNAATIHELRGHISELYIERDTALAEVVELRDQLSQAQTALSDLARCKTASDMQRIREGACHFCGCNHGALACPAVISATAAVGNRGGFGRVRDGVTYVMNAEGLEQIQRRDPVRYVEHDRETAERLLACLSEAERRDLLDSEAIRRGDRLFPDGSVIMDEHRAYYRDRVRYTEHDHTTGAERPFEWPASDGGRDG